MYADSADRLSFLGSLGGSTVSVTFGQHIKFWWFFDLMDQHMCRPAECLRGRQVWHCSSDCWVEDPVLPVSDIMDQHECRPAEHLIFLGFIPCSGVDVISKRASCSLPADDCMVKDLDTTYRRQSS
ncbi:uncharacterized protein [Littorina saxatilis]|uniref:uncharacterized protein n=1 Tax=Littorina saxatilis TaxID=31220 RepID=UPI0038B5A4EF